MTGGAARTRIERVTTIEAFERERAAWEAIERVDPHVSVFTTWRWLRAYLPIARHRWTILALREGADTLAYLPIARNGSIVDRELFLGGNPTADYTGMVALPGREHEAVDAFARALKREPADGVNFHDVRDPRVEALAERLVERGLRLESTEESRCLSCELPDTWDEYVTNRISAKTRVNMLRVERRLAEALPNFRISEPADADVDLHVEAMVRVNHARWGGNLRNAQRRYGRMFRNAYDLGVARMIMYWDGDRPIAGATAFVDRERSFFGLYMIGFDEEYGKLSPGKGIVGRAIRTAIESGFRRFDFMRGDEDYKARYASDVHVVRQFRLTHPGLRATAIAKLRPKFFELKLAVANVVYGPGRTL